MKTITRAKGGPKEHQALVNAIHIPDVWTIVRNNHDHLSLKERELLLECWHLCHDLLRAVKEAP